MKIDGQTKICGLIGNPVEHTLSPVIHAAIAEEMGHNLAYLPFLVEEGQVHKAVEGAYALHIAGLNVTVPHKSAVIPYLREIDKLAEQIGAVNTLVRTAGGFKGYNTDMPGLLRAMHSEGISLAGERVILLGAGGASRAVAFLCAGEGAKEVWLLNRSLDKAEAVAREVNAVFQSDIKPSDIIKPMSLADYKKLPEGKYLAIQGTSVGLYPHVEDVIISDRAFYQKIHTGFDLIYKPSKTKFMAMTEAEGGRAFHGLKMLLYQGIIAYELWNGAKISEEIADRVYAKLQTEMKTV